MDNIAIDGSCGGNLMSDKGSSHVGVSNGKGLQELEGAMKLLGRVEMAVAYLSEKLVNLHLLLLHMVTLDNDLGALTVDTSITGEVMEKALVLDLLSSILDSEIREVESFMDTLHKEIFDAHHYVALCRDFKELFTIMINKLYDSEECLKRSQDQVLEVKMQSAKLQQGFPATRHENRKNDNAVGVSGNGQLLHVKVKANAEQRHILRMLEKSLARELELEKKVSELLQNEEEIKLKLHYTGEVAFRMEEAAEVVWGRFLEAENSAEVLMGISKELVNKFQVAQLNLNSLVQREAEVQNRLQACIKQMEEKDTALKKLEQRNDEYLTLNAEMLALEENVKMLQKQLRESERQLEIVNASKEASQEQLIEMENLMESLKETTMSAESRAANAEEKLAQLTESNLEITEELNFLKSRDSDRDKMSSLEKQVRDLETQLQHARASAEASQEQQNMLYSAIWDMENLIEDLKSKSTKAEGKTDIAEESFIMLSETNSELNQEISFLKTKLESIEASLCRANSEKVASSKEIEFKTKLITDMVKQLTTERLCIHKQVYSLIEENKTLKKLLDNKKGASATVDFEDGGEERISRNMSKEEVSFTNSFQVDEQSKDDSASDFGDESSISEDYDASTSSNHSRMHLNCTSFFMALLLALSSASIYFYNGMFASDN